jgi:hypothetical protein
MTQVSAPVVGEQFTDTSWRDLFGDEPGVVGDLDGSAYKITLAPDSDVAQIGSSTQNSTSRVAGFSHKIPIAASEGVTIPAASGSARTDLIVVRYNPDQADPSARVRLARIAGTSAGLPAYDASPPGMEDLPLWAVTRQPGQALSQATLLDLRVRIGPALLIPVGAPLPLSSPLGTRVRQGRIEYQRVLDQSSLAVWAPFAGSEPTLTSLPINGGWLTVNGHTPRCYLTGYGTARAVGWFRNGGPFRVGDNPTVPQTPVTFPAGFRPVVQQEIKLTNSYASDPITCAILPSGQLRMDKDNSGRTYPADTAFFLDDVEFHLTYTGA